MNVLDYQNYQDYLSYELEKRIQQNHNYSLRAFSRDLNLSPGELSEVLRGKRKLSVKSAQKISSSLGFSDVEEKHLLLLVNGFYNNEAKIALAHKSLSDQRKYLLDLEYFKAIEGWYHFAILNLSDCAGFKWNTKYIAKRLGLKVYEVKTAIDRLLKLKLLKRDKAKVYVINEYVETPSDIPSGSIRNYHRSILQKSTAALDEQDVNEREISGVSFAFDPKYLKEVKKEIRDFQDMMTTKYAKGQKTEVYHLETLFFRMTKKEENK